MKHERHAFIGICGRKAPWLGEQFLGVLRPSKPLLGIGFASCRPSGSVSHVNGIFEGSQGRLRCVSAIAERSGPSLEALSQKRHPEDSQSLESPTAKLDFLGLFGLETQRPLARMGALSSPERCLEMT